MSEALQPAVATTSAVTDRRVGGFTLPQVIHRRRAGCCGQVLGVLRGGGLRTQEPGRRTGGRWGSSWGGARPEASAWVP